MYESLYGLNEDPFRMSLDARFSFHHRSYVEVKEYLEYGLSRSDGMLILLGEPGTGKSTVVNDLLVDHASTDILVAKLATPPVDVFGVIQLLANSLDVNTEGTDKNSVLKSLTNFLKDLHAAGRHALLIVDNAENIQEQGLEEMRLLSEVRQHNQPLLQILLQGHPKLLDVVRSSNMDSLRQLILSSVQLNPMEFEETRDYVQHRLGVVGWHGDPEFSDQAIDVIHQFSAGVPRQVNVICNHLLLYGCVEQIHRFDDHDVRQVIEELPPDMIKTRSVQASSTRASTASAKPQRKTNDHDNYRRSMAAKVFHPKEQKPKITRHQAPSISTLTQENTTGKFTATKASFHNDTQPTAQKPVLSNTPEARSESPTLRQFGHVPTQLKQKRSATSDTTSGHRVDPPLAGLNAGAATAIARLKSSHSSADSHQSAQTNETPPKRRSVLHSLVATIVLATVLGGPYIYHTLPTDESDSGDGKNFFSPYTSYDDLSELKGTAKQDQPAPGLQSQADDWEQWPTKLLDSNLKAPTRGSELDDAHQRSISMATTNRVIAEEFSLFSPTRADNTNMQTALDRPQRVGGNNDSSLSVGHTENVDNTRAETNSNPVENTDNKNVLTAHAKRESQHTADQVSLNTQGLSPTHPKQHIPSMITDSGIERVGGKLIINRNLESALRRYSRQVERLGDGALIITVEHGVAFEADSTVPTQKASNTLDKLAYVLRNFDGFVLQIVVYTQTRGPVENNATLPHQRAQTIANYLVARGIPATRVQFSVQGAHAIDNHSSDFNRRVEIFVRPLV